MPLFFKIFLWLLLERGVYVITNTGNATVIINRNDLSLTTSTTLCIEGERTLVQGLINVCRAEDPACETQEINVNAESSELMKLVVSFKNLSIAHLNRIMKQLLIPGILINIRQQP